MKGTAKISNAQGLREPGIERFLTFLANIPLEHGKGTIRARTEEAEKILRKYRQFLPPHLLNDVTPEDVAKRETEEAGLQQKLAAQLKEARDAMSPPLTPADLRQERVQKIWGLANVLRKIWVEQDLRRREWLIYKIRDRYHQIANPHSHYYDAPEWTPFEEAMTYFGRYADCALRCANPECPAPYFLAKDARPRTFCSPKCAGPAKQAAKLKWWRKHSKEARAKASARR